MRLLSLLLLSACAFAEDVNTFSIVAYDPVNGDWGVTVASRYFSVGAVVPWAEAGVGAIATQANVNVGYGPAASSCSGRDSRPKRRSRSSSPRTSSPDRRPTTRHY